MLAQSFKISTPLILDLAKIGVSSYKAKMERALKDLAENVK